MEMAVMGPPNTHPSRRLQMARLHPPRQADRGKGGSPRARLSAWLLIATLVGLTAFSACGGSGRSQATALDPRKAELAFARCMREHGVDVPDPRPGSKGITLSIPAGGGDPQALQRAQRSCEHLMRGAVRPPPASKRRELLEAALRYARCMRGHGVEVPDPSPGQGGVIKIGPGNDANPNDPSFQAADRACRHFLPQGGPAAEAPGGATGATPEAPAR
jgi:hypothetical protein